MTTGSTTRTAGSPAIGTGSASPGSVTRSRAVISTSPAGAAG